MNRTFIFLLPLTLASCGIKESPDIQKLSGDPVVTGEAKEVSSNSAVLSGYVSTEYLLSKDEVGFIISKSPSPSMDNGQKVVSKEIDKDGYYSVLVSHLDPGTTYYYKAYLNLGKSYLVGDIRQFTTVSVSSLPETITVYGYECVDLGLPSGLIWATMNVGASSPEEYGDYFALGETKPKSSYSWSTYKWCNGADNKLTKYCTQSDYWDGAGPMDNKTVLDLEDDAAYVHWGGSWRMPTLADYRDLLDKCTWTWTWISQNGVDGDKVIGPNGNSIFLPAAGLRSGTNLYDVGSDGHYWSSSLNADHPGGALRVSFDSGEVIRGSYSRYYGLSIRPVSE